MIAGVASVTRGSTTVANTDPGEHDGAPHDGVCCGYGCLIEDHSLISFNLHMVIVVYKNTRTVLCLFTQIKSSCGFPRHALSWRRWMPCSREGEVQVAVPTPADQLART